MLHGRTTSLYWRCWWNMGEMCFTKHKWVTLVSVYSQSNTTFHLWYSPCTQDSSTVLHWAAYGGSLECVEYLLPLFGERMFEVDKDDWSCVHYAVVGGSLPVMRYLVDQCGFDLSLRIAVSYGVVYAIVWFVHLRCYLFYVQYGYSGTATRALQYTLHILDHTYNHTRCTCITHIHTSHKLATHYNSKQCTVAIVHTLTCSPTAHHHQHPVYLHSVHLYKLLAV